MEAGRSSTTFKNSQVKGGINEASRTALEFCRMLWKLTILVLRPLDDGAATGWLSVALTEVKVGG